MKSSDSQDIGTSPAMGATEKFCLRWNDFETNISVAFRELREEKDFFDVTLACDDSQIQAHKVDCENFLMAILLNLPKHLNFWRNSYFTDQILEVNFFKLLLSRFTVLRIDVSHL